MRCAVDKPASKPGTKIGKDFEKFVDPIFRALMLEMPLYWSRLTDSAAAGNLIGAKEGDFELTFPLGPRGHSLAFTVECKASAVHASLASCYKDAIRSGQAGKMRLRVRGGFYGVYLFYSVENEEIEVWSHAPLLAALYMKRVKFYCRPAYVIDKGNFPVFARMWASNPQEILDKLIRSETVPVGE
jgi:hypothetical protein